MKNRRAFLRKGGASLLGLGSLPVLAQQAPFRPPSIHSVNNGYMITNGPRARKRSDGTWKFSARIINLDDGEHDISASLLIATDRGFNQIIDDVSVKFEREKSFICNVNYRPRMLNSKLFFRYVIEANGQAVPAVEMIVGSISPWDNESRGE
jgi:hypothetical protein